MLRGLNVLKISIFCRPYQNVTNLSEITVLRGKKSVPIVCDNTYADLSPRRSFIIYTVQYFTRLDRHNLI